MEITLDAEITEGRELTLELPPDIPIGNVQVTIRTLDTPQLVSSMDFAKLSKGEQDKLLANAAALMEDEYRNDPNLVVGEALDGKDFFDETPAR